jgi:hypothetical protein
MMTHIILSHFFSFLFFFVIIDYINMFFEATYVPSPTLSAKTLGKRNKRKQKNPRNKHTFFFLCKCNTQDDQDSIDELEEKQVDHLIFVIHVSLTTRLYFYSVYTKKKKHNKIGNWTGKNRSRYSMFFM